MVSKRKIRFVFTENEKVLCYEPDPKKAKVLYESKILRCCIGKDGNGKKCPQYLVHFYGWNSSWDRIVKECDIVKDNAHNRTLQRQLAEKAAVGLPKGKKLKLNKIPAIIKEIVVNNTNNGSQSDSDDDTNDMDTNDTIRFDADEDTQEDTDRQSSITSDDYNSWNSCRTSIRTSVSNDGMTTEANTYDESDSQSLICCLTIELKTILDKDYIHSAKNKTLYDLPLKPNVWQIIDEFSVNTNINLLGDSNTNTNEQNDNHIVSEFKNSMEIYFNALIENNYLFYNEEEKKQFKQIQSQSDDTFNAITVYGFIHLLRLMVTISDFLLSTPGMTKEQLKIIVRLIKHFVDYLNKNRINFSTHQT
ncbi:male-specific lethal 3 homolog [Oppia nitens]|uniref:male-specific lethal 3 homolog n=1 Tax=Oppia nitens TaxID=1686743 RepID=UPI0023DC9AFC|nr:male-specific lethal 3 homolog [Oppia nitens]